MRKIEKIVADHADWFRGRKVLDIACGDGDFTKLAAKHAKAVVGIDLSLDKAKPKGGKRLPKKVRLIEMDASALDFPDESFDAVFAYNALGHLAEAIAPCTREMMRVLRTGGDLGFIATWKMDRAILDSMEDRTPGSGMVLHEAVDDAGYAARVWRKRGPGTGDVWIRQA
jgi:ubiquinone/menaquinone biosynthesis C-methylase UbiE